MNKFEKLFRLFITTSSISATTNGGYAIVSAMKKKFVEEYQWMEEKEMMDLIAIAQSCPGPIAINSSIIVGYREVGLLGAVITVLGTVSPPLIIMSLVTVFYQQIASNELIITFMSYMASGVAALLIDVTLGMFTSVTKEKKWYTYVLIMAVFLLRLFTDISILLIALACIILGILKAFLTTRKVNQNEY